MNDEWHFQRREKKLEAKKTRIKKHGQGLKTDYPNAIKKRVKKNG